MAEGTLCLVPGTMYASWNPMRTTDPKFSALSQGEVDCPRRDLSHGFDLSISKQQPNEEIRTDHPSPAFSSQFQGVSKEPFLIRVVSAPSGQP